MSEGPYRPRVGDDVRLRGGGPRMTISAVVSETLHCRWFTVDGDLRTAPFVVGELDVLEGVGDLAPC